VTLDPAKAFGGSAFGPLRFRPVSAEGVQGDWQPLATLVRVPQLKELKCAEGAALCTLVGTDLFLLDRSAQTPSWPMRSPCRKALATRRWSVPRPNGTLYLKLRDDPTVVNTAVLPVTPEPGHLLRSHRSQFRRRPATAQQATPSQQPAPVANQSASPGPRRRHPPPLHPTSSGCGLLQGCLRLMGTRTVIGLILLAAEGVRLPKRSNPRPSDPTALVRGATQKQAGG